MPRALIQILLVLFAAGAAAQTAEPVPKAELQLLSDVVRLIKRDFARATDDAVLASACADSLAAAAETSERAARTLEALPRLLMRAHAAPRNKLDYRKLTQACVEGMVAMLDAHSQYLDETAMRDLYRRPRDPFALQSVRGDWGEGEVLELRVLRFTAQTYADLNREIVRLVAGGREPRGIVIDLRDNAGGLLGAAVDVSGLFLAEGVAVGAIRGRSGRLIDSFRVNGRGQRVFLPPLTLPERVAAALRRAPLALLVNRKSASGAEILAAALQGNGRGVLVGEPTLGLGAIQTIYPLGAAAAGPALKLTSSYWYGPQDTGLDGRPLAPDVPASESDAMAAARRWVSSAGASH